MLADDLTMEVWGVDSADFPSEAPFEHQARFLLRYAILAPSSHNSQPWGFTIDGPSIGVHADEGVPPAFLRTAWLGQELIW